MQDYGWNNGWMWAPAVIGVLVVIALVSAIGKASRK
jgi:hypothetical protein